MSPRNASPRKSTGKSTRKQLALPRVPLPRQTEQTHEDKTRRPARKAKHKRPPTPEET